MLPSLLMIELQALIMFLTHSSILAFIFPNNPLSLLASSLIEFASVSINSHPLATSSCLTTSSVTSSPRVFLSEFISSAIISSMFMPVDFVNASNKMNVSKVNAGRLVMTESAYFSSTTQKECFKELDVERYEIVATLDGHTSDICQEMDGKVFKMSEYEEGVTAPPFHVNCRSCTAPYFDDEFTKDEQRATRDEDSNTYYVPADMTYKEWNEKYVNSELREKSLRTKRSSKKGVSKGYEDKYNYGVNWKVVKSKEYGARFSKISDDEKVTSLIAKRSRDALKNRDGKKTEELYAISLTTGKDVSSITDQHIPFGINRTFKFDKDVKSAEDNDEKVLLIHNHPRGLPPSVSDLNELLNHKNVSGITVGSNGSIYYYSKPNDEINEEDFTVAEKHFKQYTDDVARYEKTMELLAKRYEFVFLKL